MHILSTLPSLNEDMSLLVLPFQSQNGFQPDKCPKRFGGQTLNRHTYNKRHTSLMSYRKHYFRSPKFSAFEASPFQPGCYLPDYVRD